ncbi:MAG TPA: inorganic phosphate transporter [Bacillota bacterium]|nr:inorganic phosphate transporter [Bacillota bacterium]
MIFTFIALGVALFFAMNIGASGTAASMGAAYGSGVIKRRPAMILVALCAFAGAVLGGDEVVKTIGNGIIPKEILSVSIVIIILGSATLTLFISNLMGIPLSTSEVTVGAIVGVGVAYESVYIHSLIFIVAFWIAIPIISFLIAYVVGKGILVCQKKWPELEGRGKWAKGLGKILILCGCIEAFSAGMNNVANAVGPLVGANMITTGQGIWVGSFFLALGAIFLGGKVLETNGKKITRLSLLQGSTVSATGGSLVIIASIFGVPVPLTQVTTAAILGVGTAENGLRLWQKEVIRKIMKVWIVSPISSLVVSYTLVNLVLTPNLYVVFMILSVFISTVGLISLSQTMRREKSTINDQGGGI